MRDVWRFVGRVVSREGGKGEGENRKSFTGKGVHMGASKHTSTALRQDECGPSTQIFSGSSQPAQPVSQIKAKCGTGHNQSHYIMSSSISSLFMIFTTLLSSLSENILFPVNSSSHQSSPVDSAVRSALKSPTRRSEAHKLISAQRGGMSHF